MKGKKGRWIPLFGAGMFGVSVLLSCVGCMGGFWTTETRNRLYQKTYTLRELQQIEASSFRRLNEIEYPSVTAREIFSVSEEYREAVYDFAMNVYTHAEKTADFSFSPIGLYSTLSLLSLASDEETTLAALDGVLGMTKETRRADFLNMYKTNFFCNENGTMQQYNASFQTTKLSYNRSYIDALTAHYAEAYAVDFSSDVGVQKILEWIDQKTGENGFWREEDLSIKENTALMLFSTLFFDNKWSTTYNDSRSYRAAFYGSAGEEEAVFMNHSYMGDCYDYGDYLAFYDYYRNDMKIKYFTPKEEGDIFALTSGKDLLRDDENYRIRPTYGEEDADLPIVVNLSVPKFSKTCLVDFSEILKEMGLSDLFAKTSHSFNHAFSGLSEDTSVYLSFVKQKNKVTFTEEGTTIKSVTYAQLEGATSAAPMDSIDIRLDRPFIYVVYDANNLPVYIGSVNNAE